MKPPPLPGVRFSYGRFKQFEFKWEDKHVEVVRGGLTALLFACRNCGRGVEGSRRRFYCTGKCASAWRNEHIDPTDWRYWRRRAIQRDGVCVICKTGPGTEAARALTHAEELASQEWNRAVEAEDRTWQNTAWEKLRAARTNLGRIALQVDHIKPVALFPELEYTLSNLRTLCAPCHAQYGAKPKRRLDPSETRLEVRAP